MFQLSNIHIVIVALSLDGESGERVQLLKNTRQSDNSSTVTVDNSTSLSFSLANTSSKKAIIGYFKREDINSNLWCKFDN